MAFWCAWNVRPGGTRSDVEGIESNSKSDWFERDSTGVLLLCAGEAGGKSGWPLLFLKLDDE